VVSEGRTDVDTVTTDQAGDPGIEWLTVPDVAERLGIPVTRVHQLLREGGLAGQRSGGVLRVPALFLRGDAVVKGLSGVLTLLHDGGYDDAAAIRWLHTPDDTLPGSPVEALQADRSREVKRRAQALAF
jgi:excisionase family DNA binding protein